MNLKQGVNVRLFPEPQQDSELRKIQPKDTFPCYACFDENGAREQCQICNQLGFVSGDHPMVIFIDDFLNKNLRNQLLPMNGQNKQTEEQEKYSFPGSNPQRKQCRSALESYTSTRPLSKQELCSHILKSSNPTAYNRQQIHTAYSCDYCQSTPIKGKRFHCDECVDYDLCEKCFKNEMESQGHQAMHKMKRVLVGKKTEDVIMQLTRSFVQNSK